jgi:hypothetical protein
VSKLPPQLRHLTDELPPKERADIEAAIASSPYLQQRMLESVRIGQLEHIRITDAGINEGGHYDDRKNTIHISPNIFSRTDFKNDAVARLDALTSILGHENGHALYAKEAEKTLYFVTGSVSEQIRDAGPGGSVDLTPYVGMFQQSARRDEALAEIEGWNALASRLNHLSDEPVSRKDMLDRAASTTACIKESGGALTLARGIVLDPDMSMSDWRIPKHGLANLEPVAACHFDNSGKSLGRGGAANYANYYGAYLIEQIGQDTDAWQNPPTIKLDMAKLGLDKAQLESTGLNLGGRDLHFYDISGGRQRPVVVRHSGDGVTGRPDIEPELAQRPSPAQQSMMSEAGHPAHGMYAQALAALRASRNIPAGTFTEHEEQVLAAGIVAKALTQSDVPLRPRVDHAVLSRDGSMVIGVQGPLDSPANRLAGVDIRQALAMPSIEEFSDVARTAMHSIQHRQEQAQVQAETFGIEAPTGPIMRMGARTVNLPVNPGGPPNSGDSGGDGGGG